MSTNPKEKSMHYYWVHGLCISSALLLPELYPLSPADAQSWSVLSLNVSIELGKTPEFLENPKSEGVLYQAVPDRFLLRIDGIARYLVEGGSRIVIEPDLQATEDEIRFFLFGSPMGALLHQRNVFILHGSAIETDRGAVVFIGSSGAGKSAIAAAFLQRGYRVLTDEICTVTIDEKKQFVVQPGLAEIYLWRDVLKKLAYNPESLRRVRPGLQKYALASSEANPPQPPQPTPLRVIYHLEIFNELKVNLASTKPREKIQHLLARTYQEPFFQVLGDKTKRFERTTQIARNAEIKGVKRPKGSLDYLDDLTETIEKDWRD